MSNQAEQQLPAPVETGPSFRSVATMLLGAPAIYSIYFVAGYFLAEISCSLGLLQFELAGMNAMILIELVLAVLALAAIVGLAWRPYRRWRREPPRASRGEPGGNTNRFAAAAGLWLSLYFALLTVLTGVAVLVVIPCRWS
ncbi:MAG TPA: hypothetical protein VNK95_20245 [Caldilineaceae bacterium]|nr:hypothetical protein [Caldilineaceae bacterium]